MNGEEVAPQAGRIRDLQERIRAAGLSAAVLVYSRDVYYYTGTAQPSYLVILPDEYRLFVRSGHEFALREAAIPPETIGAERRLEKVRDICLAGLGAGAEIGLELDVLTVEQYGAFRKILPDCRFRNVSPLILEQRKTKDPTEIARIRAACRAVDAGHTAVLRTLREGITELELAAAVEHAHRLAGHEGTFFIRKPDFFMSSGAMSSGPNLFRISGVVYSISGVGLSPSVPAGASRRTIAKGDPVMLDIPTLVEGYHADQSRTYIVGAAGKPIREMYACLREIADVLVNTMKPGMTGREIYALAMEQAGKRKIEDTFLSFGPGKRGRMIGHGVGVELNEPPVLSEYETSAIPDRCVVALDMHVLDPAVGAVKLEDMVLVTRNGNEILTQSPRELFEV